MFFQHLSCFRTGSGLGEAGAGETAPAVGRLQSRGDGGHGEGRVTGGRFSTVVLGPPQEECLQCRKCEPQGKLPWSGISERLPGGRRGYALGPEGGLGLARRSETGPLSRQREQRAKARAWSLLGAGRRPARGRQTGREAEVGRSHGAPQPAVRAGSLIASQQGAPDKA